MKYYEFLMEDFENVFDSFLMGIDKIPYRNQKLIHDL